MRFNYNDMDIKDIEYSRHIILKMLKHTGSLMDNEKKTNGIKTMEYKRLSKDFDAIKYIEDLIVEKLRKMLY